MNTVQSSGGGGGHGGPLKNGRAEELAAAAPAQRNWRGILIALLVIAAVLGLIMFSIVLLTPANDGKGSKGRRPTRQDVLGNKFKSPPFNGTWLSDTELVFRDQWGGLVLFNVNNFTRRSLMTNTTFRELNAVDFKVSPDLHFVLLLSDIKTGWRYARFAKYYVYEVLTRNKYPLSPIEEDRHAPPLQYAEWAPNGGGGVVFVYQNDIYYKPKVHKKLVCRITNSGVSGIIFNGMPDFLYETEILQQDRALWFSPDGQQLMFMTFNDSQVGEYRYSWYGLSDPETPAYPTIESIRYPKTNTANPEITVFTVSLKTPKFLFPKPLQLTSQVDANWYIRWLSWISEKQIVLLLLNRPQNISIISICNIQHYNCQDVVRDESDTTRWSGLGAEPPGDDCGWCGAAPVVHGRGGIISTVPLLDNADTGYWRHAVHFTQITRTPLTQGDYEITGLMGWDDNRQILYVMGTLSDTPGERHLYRVRAPTVEGTMWPEQALCLTCPDSDLPAPDVLVEATALNDEPLIFDNITLDWELPSSTVQPHEESNDNETLPQSCLYNRITFSKNFSNFVQECLGPGPPVIWVSGWRGDKKLLLSGGEALRSRVSQLATPQSRVFRVQVGGGRTARVRLLFPPGFKESDDLPLPLVLQVDGSPGSQLISEKFQIDWSWYLASTRNFIVAQIDARGSGFQGEDLRTAIYHKLLSVDIEDQIAVLSYLRDTLKIVDGTRIGVWGSGYGAGAALALAADDLRNVTRCVVALTPITDLLHHISFWTERYGGWGGRWRGSLESTAVWRRAGNLPPRRLLLAQALADTRHHAAHSLHLARALVKADALYMHLVYPDETHLFEESEMHLYRQIEDFFDECFGPVDLADWDNDVGNFFAFRD